MHSYAYRYAMRYATVFFRRGRYYRDYIFVLNFTIIIRFRKTVLGVWNYFYFTIYISVNVGDVSKNYSYKRFDRKTNAVLKLE